MNGTFLNLPRCWLFLISSLGAQKGSWRNSEKSVPITCTIYGRYKWDFSGFLPCSTHTVRSDLQTVPPTCVCRERKIVQKKGGGGMLCAHSGTAGESAKRGHQSVPIADTLPREARAKRSTLRHARQALARRSAGRAGCDNGAAAANRLLYRGTEASPGRGRRRSLDRRSSCRSAAVPRHRCKSGAAPPPLPDLSREQRRRPFPNPGQKRCVHRVHWVLAREQSGARSLGAIARTFVS